MTGGQALSKQAFWERVCVVNLQGLNKKCFGLGTGGITLEVCPSIHSLEVAQLCGWGASGGVQILLRPG